MPARSTPSMMCERRLGSLQSAVACMRLHWHLHAGKAHLEGLEPFLDGLSIVIAAPAGLASAEQPLLHGLQWAIKEQDQPRQADSLLKGLCLHK